MQAQRSESDQALIDALTNAVKSGHELNTRVLVILQCFEELREDRELAEGCDKPLFFLLEQPSGQVYLNPAAIALVTRDAYGNADIVTVNGSVLGIEALQWQLMVEAFHRAIDLRVIKSSSGLVSA